MDTNRIIQGDALTVLKTLPAELVDCVITSPPYWALRDYKVSGQLGLEPTFTEYLDKLLAIFDEIRRVLKKTGTVWVNLGDTFNGAKVGNTHGMGKGSLQMKEGQNDQEFVKDKVESIKDKSLLAIPDRFKIAMIDRGWICRNDLIWWKRNCMPSSAKDRFTVDYERVFFFTKSERYYFETQYEPYAEATMKDLRHLTPEESFNNPDKYTENPDVQGGNNSARRISKSIHKNMPKFGGNKAAGYGNPTYSGDEWQPAQFGRLKRCVFQIDNKYMMLKEDLDVETKTRVMKELVERGVL